MFEYIGDPEGDTRWPVRPSETDQEDEPEPRGIGIRVFYFVSAVACLLGIMPVAIVIWQLLPPDYSGFYPAVLAGLPALPLLCLSSIFFNRSGVRLERFARRSPTFFKAVVYVVFTSLAIGFILALDYFGLLY